MLSMLALVWSVTMWFIPGVSRVPRARTEGATTAATGRSSPGPSR
jgi:hypothetical protein